MKEKSGENISIAVTIATAITITAIMSKCPTSECSSALRPTLFQHNDGQIFYTS